MSKRILVAPLDWGLGHAARCIPIVYELLAQGAEVVLASNGRAYALLKQEFPMLMIEKLPAYDIRYATDNMFWNIGTQLPKIGRAIWKEHQVLEKMIRRHRIDAVISDNRYGCFSPLIKSIFVTHQLQILIPNIILQKAVNFFNRQFINRFDECWIPDIAGGESLGGKLSELPAAINGQYIGILSRMQPLPATKTQDVIVVLSGPEPQRTRLEQLILQQVRNLPQQFLIVQGKTGLYADAQVAENIRVVSFLTSEALNQVIVSSKCVVCRAGYSSVMDLAVLGKKAVLIPTPGQTEQEYLAERFLRKGIFYSQPQSAFRLQDALDKAQQFRGLEAKVYQHSRLQLRAIIGNFLERL